MCISLVFIKLGINKLSNILGLFSMHALHTEHFFSIIKSSIQSFRCYDEIVCETEIESDEIVRYTFLFESSSALYSVFFIASSTP